MKGMYTSSEGITMYLARSKYPKTGLTKLALYTVEDGELCLLSEITMDGFSRRTNEIVVLNLFTKQISRDIKDHYRDLLCDPEQRIRQVNSGFSSYQLYVLKRNILDGIPRVEHLESRLQSGELPA